MAHHPRRSLLASCLFALDVGAAALAVTSPALADPARVARAASPVSADASGSAAPPSAPSRPRAKVTALDGHDATPGASADSVNGQINKNTGAPIHVNETRIAAIGDARAVGVSSAGEARGVGPATDEATAAAIAVQPAHRRLAGLPGGAGGASKETADAVAAAMPRLIACLPARDDDLQGGEALIKATVVRGGAVLASTVGSFSAMPSSVASCFSVAMGAVSFDPARMRPAVVPVHLKVADIDKHRAPVSTAVASTP